MKLMSNKKRMLTTYNVHDIMMTIWWLINLTSIFIIFMKKKTFLQQTTARIFFHYCLTTRIVCCLHLDGWMNVFWWWWRTDWLAAVLLTGKIYWLLLWYVSNARKYYATITAIESLQSTSINVHMVRVLKNASRTTTSVEKLPFPDFLVALDLYSIEYPHCYHYLFIFARLFKLLIKFLVVVILHHYHHQTKIKFR